MLIGKLKIISRIIIIVNYNYKYYYIRWFFNNELYMFPF